MAKLSRTEARKKIKSFSSSDTSVVFTNGCFDLIHPGHVHLLSEASNQGDYLVVGLNTDDSVRRLKGDQRPVQSEEDRATVLNALSAVDDTVFFSEDTPQELIQELKPDVLVKGSDYKVSEIVGADIVQSSGGRVYRVDLLPDQSTTSLIQKIRSNFNNDKGE